MKKIAIHLFAATVSICICYSASVVALGLFPYHDTSPHDAIAKITILESNGMVIETGTGFAISQDKVLTSAHLCVNGGDTLIKFGDSEMSVDKVSFSGDICLLSFINNHATHYLRVSRSPPKVDDTVTIIGYPLGLSLQVTTKGTFAGVLNNEMGISGPRSLFSCPTTTGNSGSPILNTSGKVIGVQNNSAPAYRQVTLGSTYEDLIDFLKGN
jgi:V8-like Glu-specific endopeptidase